MKSIYSCKLYKASSRKDKIQCALSNPMNSELVAQLSEYLDEEYQTPEYLEGNLTESDLSVDNLDSDNIDDSASFESSGPSGGFSGGHPSSRTSGPGPIQDIPLDDDSENTESEETSMDTDNTDDIDPDEDDILDIDLDGSLSDVEESTDLGVDINHPEDGLNTQCDTVEIKNILESQKDTQGINHILIKGNELWIYYDDVKNLNNVMGPVIETINSSGYSYLEFNRLARSSNAIVFQICKQDAVVSIEPLEVDLDA